MSNNSLRGKRISATYETLVQTIDGIFYDGAGNVITSGVSGSQGPQGLQGPTVSLGSTYSVPADPTTTASVTGVMMGLAISFTPSRSGNVFITVSGDMDKDISSMGAQTQIRYSTGVAPVNGDALTGSTIGGLVQSNASRDAFSLNGIVYGLTLNTSIWIDISLATFISGTARIRDLSVSVIEI